jgi:hypothetical protein
VPVFILDEAASAVVRARFGARIFVRALQTDLYDRRDPAPRLAGERTLARYQPDRLVDTADQAWVVLGE